MLLIKNGTVVTAEETMRVDVLCADDKVQEIAPRIAAPKAAQVIDARGCLLMPGGIDPHTHMQLPFMGTVAADDFYTGTKAALVRRHDYDCRFLYSQPAAAAMGGLPAVAGVGCQGRL